MAARAPIVLFAAGIVATAAVSAYRINDGAGSCLSADQNGGCAARPGD